ncbi:GNAT family N-acetyltransferase [Roseibium marinum]|uniref:Ribosomal protein S18 acetylase RimI-like enzyme n=1 Tax=Roseibium marinum TaxID=281252 RepID=A0A2S3UQ53_9HYPH|nr:GNAT family N-acetyltransferase [Roseibium marinum]POF29842.1 ribosomal protein S18 acetylase RimI-like enzyme [Roseibium marinum]
MHGQTLDMNGFWDVPDGKVAVVVTYLEMLKAPEAPLARPREDLTLERWPSPDIDAYRRLFRQIGEDWIWFGRLIQEDAALKNMLAEPARENFLPKRDGAPVGTLELDYANPEEPEISYFGLIPEAIGGGAGRWLMAQAVEMAWARPETRRLWLHTCTADSPQALGFYMSCGFRPYKRSVEIADDPRHMGLYSRDKAPHVPAIG